jgi:hypothetical protein
MTAQQSASLLYRGAGVAPTDSADDPVSVGRNTRARTHIVELLARARQRTRERTHAVVAGIWLYVHGIFQFCWGLQVFVKKGLPLRRTDCIVSSIWPSLSAAGGLVFMRSLLYVCGRQIVHAGRLLYVRPLVPNLVQTYGCVVNTQLENLYHFYLLLLRRCPCDKSTCDRRRPPPSDRRELRSTLYTGCRRCMDETRCIRGNVHCKWSSLSVRVELFTGKLVV